MQIKLDQLCGLSTNAAWQAWLWRFSPELYQELAEHLRTSKGCGHNRDMMLQLIQRIQQQPEGQQRLVEFLRVSFPHLLQPGAEPVPQSSRVPFSPEATGVLTFPRRMVLQNSDPKQLQEQLRGLVQGQARVDSVIIGDRAFVEYVPIAQGALVEQIPAKNWLIARWRRGEST